MSTRLLRVTLARDADIVTARQRARQIGTALGLDPQDQTRLATAVSEIARNAVEHGGGGLVEFTLVGATAPQLIEVTISDHGHGIVDTSAEEAARPRPSAGLGLGLAGAERLVDRFAITTAPGRGTKVTLAKLLPPGSPLIDQGRIGRLVDELARQAPDGTLDELKRQNRELLVSLKALHRQRQQLTALNRELEDTNRGVLALYAELDEKAEHLKRADELKTRFLSNMTHEFRTPLSSILALCKLLEHDADGPLNAEQARQVGFVRKSAESLSELVEDLLDIAKVAAGKTVIRPAEFRIADLFSALRGMLRPLLVSSRVELVFESADDLPAVYGDESKLSQILRNFISNALKFTEAGEVRVSARVDPSAEQLTIAVKDTGIGIAPEHHARIFEEFSQLESLLQRKFKGTGLGLPLSRRLAELMGGKVSLESALGKGSTFAVTLPLRYREPSEGETKPDAAEAALDPSRIPVLAVEDNPADMAVIEASLRHSPYQLVKTRTLAEARRALIEAQPKAVLLDVVLGNDQSWGLLAELKRAPEMAGVPVLVLSSIDDPAKAAALGADAWTQKPVPADWLIERLDRLVRQRRRPRVLVIDDDDISRYLLRQHLAPANVTVEEATGGRPGIAAARQLAPDLVLLDLSMPDMDGYAVLDELAADPATSRLLVAIVTAAALSEADRRRLGHARAVLSKRELDAPVLADLVRQQPAEASPL